MPRLHTTTACLHRFLFSGGPSRHCLLDSSKSSRTTESPTARRSPPITTTVCPSSFLVLLVLLLVGFSTTEACLKRSPPLRGGQLLVFHCAFSSDRTRPDCHACSRSVIGICFHDVVRNESILVVMVAKEDGKRDGDALLQPSVTHGAFYDFLKILMISGRKMAPCSTSSVRQARSKTGSTFLPILPYPDFFLGYIYSLLARGVFHRGVPTYR